MMSWLGRYAMIVLASVLVTLLWPAGLTLAQEAVEVPLEAVGNSGVSGTARLVAEGEGTQVTVELTGLAAGVQAVAMLHAGTCDLQGASFAPLPDLVADADGRAAASGPILFHGTEDVALSAIADGEHVIVVRAGSEMVACGVIPRLPSGTGVPAPAPEELPVTGGAEWPTVVALVVLLGVGGASAGLGLLRRGLA